MLLHWTAGLENSAEEIAQDDLAAGSSAGDNPAVGNPAGEAPVHRPAGVGCLEQTLERQPGSRTIPPSVQEKHAYHHCLRGSFVLAWSAGKGYHGSVQRCGEFSDEHSP